MYLHHSLGYSSKGCPNSIRGTRLPVFKWPGLVLGRTVHFVQDLMFTQQCCWKDLSFLGCDAVLLDECFQIFHRMMDEYEGNMIQSPNDTPTHTRRLESKALFMLGFNLIMFSIQTQTKPFLNCNVLPCF